MEIKDINKLAKIVSEQELTRLEIVDGDFELLIEKGADVQQAQVAAAPLQYAQAPAPPPAPPSVRSEQDTDEPDSSLSGLVEINSPIVGTFYRSPSPEADAFVNVGSNVNEESVVCIVEAMKVMNEIHAETSGVIREILVDNATPVQFGQPLFLVEPR